MNTAEKVREDRVRRMLTRQGYMLTKSRRRDPRAHDFGYCAVISERTGDVVFTATGERSLDDVEQWTESDPADRAQLPPADGHQGRPARKPHPTQRLRAPDGSHADIDILLVPLIRTLWKAGYQTIGCCQDHGESLAEWPRKSAYWKGCALVEMPVDDACRLIDAVKHTPEFQPRMHWAADGAWEMSLPVAPFPPFSDEADVLPWVQLHFPAGQVGDLVNMLREAG